MPRYVFVLAAAALAAFAFFHPGVSRPPPRPAIDQTAASATSDRVPSGRRPAVRASLVYVVGAVRSPGLYRVPADARAEDAVKLAGGMLARADSAGVNLAQPLADGDEVYVPALGEAPRRAAPRSRSHRGHRARRHRSADNAADFKGHLDVNAATADALGSVPGIGPAIAERIVTIRAQEGAFSSLDELLDVSGMTARRLEDARPFLYISD